MIKLIYIIYKRLNYEEDFVFTHDVKYINAYILF